ncbi:MAG: glutaredoxin family protein [Gammaproteobacteria bacterium]|nr:glutaredoxin family protein [Gammaproteobacteria bacterium]
MQITLYTTAGCHLCDLADAILLALPTQYHLEILYTEIGDDDDLVERYGIRIPVIQFPDGTEIGWPFEQHDIETKLSQL